MTTIASWITSLTIVYSTVYSDADNRKHQSSASLACVWGIHRDRWIPRTKGQLRGKCFHLMTSSWIRELGIFKYPHYWPCRGIHIWPVDFPHLSPTTWNALAHCQWRTLSYMGWNDMYYTKAHKTKPNCVHTSHDSPFDCYTFFSEIVVLRRWLIERWRFSGINICICLAYLLCNICPGHS